jgi:hypothetical protein
LKYLEDLKKAFSLALYTSGGHYRVGIDINNIGYLINTDDSIFTCTIDSIPLNCKDIIRLYESQKGLVQIEDTNNLTVIAEWDNSKQTIMFYNRDKSINDVLFEKYILFQLLTDRIFIPEYYVC